MCQCLDERSNLAKGALEMFPNVLSIAMTQTGEAFQYLDDIFSSLFLVLRNKRSKDLTQTANECCIQCVDMIMDWHEHGQLDNEVLLEICHIFRDNTNSKEMKHDKVRERCCAYFGYILYGINEINEMKQIDITDKLKEENDIEIPTETKIINDSINPLSPESMNTLSPDSINTLSPDSTLLSPKLFTKTSHIHAKSANDIFSANNDDEEKWVPSPRESIVGQKNAFKISKVMKRKYLLSDNKQFIEYLNDAINNGLNDKSGDVKIV